MGAATTRGSMVGSPSDHAAVELLEVGHTQQRPGVGGGVFVQQQAALAVGSVERRAVHQAHVVDGHRSGRAHQRHGLVEVDVAGIGVHGAAEAAVGVVIVGRAVVAARDHHQRAVVHVAIVEIDAGRQHVVVGMGIEGPVLVPFDRRAVAGGFHVELAAVLADRRPQELRQDRRDLGIAGQRMEEGVALEDRRFQPAHARQRRAVGGLEIIEIVVGRNAARFANDAVGKVAQLGELLALDQARDHQIAVAPISLDLLVGEHADDHSTVRRLGR